MAGLPVLVDRDFQGSITVAGTTALTGNVTAAGDLEVTGDLIAPALITEEITDPGASGAIPVTSSGSCAVTTVASEARSVAIPTFAGQQLSVSFDVDGGDLAITYAGGINQAGNTIATGADAGDHILTIGVQVAGALVWRVVANDGFTLS